MLHKTAPLPPAYAAAFRDGIDHPDLWLWDSWTLKAPDGAWHLYCLALSRTGADGALIHPRDRNNFKFHVRRFSSSDDGWTWHDMGAIILPGRAGDGSDSRNVWSGSVLGLSDGTNLFGFTGVRDLGPERAFLQSICIATGTGPDLVSNYPNTAVSCPLRDYDEILAKGYYLGPHDTLGSRDGEDGGPIMAWRDPFLFETADGELRAVWSAKVSPTRPAIAQARLKRAGDRIELLELGPPMELPDAELMTQAEVPKIYFDPKTGDYLMLVSACDRQHEGQPDSEVTQIHRLYRSRSPSGPWKAYGESGSRLPGLDGLFGASLVQHDLSAGRLIVIGPYTENAGPERHLRFSEPREILIGTRADSERAGAA